MIIRDKGCVAVKGSALELLIDLKIIMELIPMEIVTRSNGKITWEEVMDITQMKIPKSEETSTAALQKVMNEEHGGRI